MGIISARPRVLHLFSDWKWTGPAEPIVNLVRQLRRRGYPVDLACTRGHGDYQQSLEHRARARRVEPVLDFKLKKKFNIFTNLSDLKSLTEYMDKEEVQIVHVHTSHDHLLGSRAARRSLHEPRVVRTNHRGEPLRGGFFSKLLINGHTDGWVALTKACLDADLRQFDISPSHGVVVEGAIDLERFNPENRHADVRTELGVGREDLLFGIVARVQTHRRFDVLLPALAAAMKKEPRIRGMIIGRGTHFDALAREPVKQLGIEDKVIMPGYRADDYADYLAALDVKMFLVPGSDGSCRAVREAMALGKPVLAARRGLLPELVEDGKCGLVVDDTQENLTRAMLKLAHDDELRLRLGRNAAAKAREAFDIDAQVERIGELYQRLAEEL